MSVSGCDLFPLQLMICGSSGNHTKKETRGRFLCAGRITRLNSIYPTGSVIREQGRGIAGSCLYFIRNFSALPVRTV